MVGGGGGSRLNFVIFIIILISVKIREDTIIEKLMPSENKAFQNIKMLLYNQINVGYIFTVSCL
jgi:hypothetical protein